MSKPNRKLTSEQFTRLHAEGSYKWGLDWLRVNMHLRDIASIYGLDTTKYKDMLTEMAEGVCKALLGPGKQEHDLDSLAQEASETLDEHDAKLTLSDALDLLDGHTVLSVKAARAICETMGCVFDESLVMHWNGVGDAAANFDIHGVTGKGEGVGGRGLSNSLCTQLGISPVPGNAYSGRGFATNANKAAISQHFRTELAEKYP